MTKAPNLLSGCTRATARAGERSRVQVAPPSVVTSTRAPPATHDPAEARHAVVASSAETSRATGTAAGAADGPLGAVVVEVVDAPVGAGVVGVGRMVVVATGVVRVVVTVVAT
jgi:hypothetical protein